MPCVRFEVTKIRTRDSWPRNKYSTFNPFLRQEISLIKVLGVSFSPMRSHFLPIFPQIPFFHYQPISGLDTRHLFGGDFVGEYFFASSANAASNWMRADRSICLLNESQRYHSLVRQIIPARMVQSIRIKAIALRTKHSLMRRWPGFDSREQQC